MVVVGVLGKTLVVDLVGCRVESERNMSVKCLSWVGRGCGRRGVPHPHSGQRVGFSLLMVKTEEEGGPGQLV